MNDYQRITQAIACPACDNSPISMGDGYHLDDQGSYTGDCDECYRSGLSDLGRQIQGVLTFTDTVGALKLEGATINVEIKALTDEARQRLTALRDELAP